MTCVDAMAADVNEEAVSEVLAELAEAEAAEAEARAEAARAKATAVRLRGGEPDADDAEDVEADDADDADDAELDPRGWWARIGAVTVAVAATVILAIASLVVTGLMIVAHQKVTARQAHQAEL